MSFVISSVKRFVFERETIISLILLAPVIISFIFAPYIVRFDPLKIEVGPSLIPPNWKFLMGTDQLGSDLFSQLVFGSRIAVFVAVISTFIALAIAVPIGVIAGYYRRFVDEGLMRFTDLILSIPSFLLIIFLVVLFGSNIDVITIVIGIVSWPTMARIIRAEVLSLREREFVLAAKAVGSNPFSIMFGEILPNVWIPLLPAITLQMGGAILLEAGISFLGLGDQNTSSWGKILFLANNSIFSGDWWGIIFPGVAIIITILGFNLLGDALGKSLNVRDYSR